MATIPTTLLFAKNRSYGVGGITFDLILSESHNFNSSITSYNIEDGSNISDHIRKENFTGSVSGLITNFDIFGGELVENRAQAAYDQIEQLYNDQELVKVVSILKVFENVVITGISVARSTGSGEALAADFSFQTVNIVQLQSVQIEASISLLNMNTKQNRQASPKLDTGKEKGTSYSWDFLDPGL